MASRRKKSRSGKSSRVRVRFTADDLSITGPKARETELRDALETKLRVALEAACPWFAQSGLAARTAFKIAYSARFGVLDRETVTIRGLAVTYQNRGAWKPWIAVTEASADLRRAIRSKPVSTFSRLTERQGMTKGEANAEMRERTAKARAKAERAKKRGKR